MDKISVIIPVYNTNAEYLDECITSVINQTYKNLEIIIVDDGSTKETANLCDSYKDKDKRIIVEHKKNEGVSVARNFGIKKATGKWISFVDSDDYLELDAYEKMIPQRDCDVVISRFNQISEKASMYTEEDKIEADYISDDIEKEILIKNIFYPTLRLSVSYVFLKLYKKDFLIENNIFFTQGIPLCEDGLFNLEVYEKSEKIFIVKDVTINYRINQQSVTQKYSANCLENTIKLLSEYKTRFWNVIEPKCKSEYYCFAIWCLNFALVKQIFHSENKKKNKEKIEILKKAISNNVYREAIENVDINKLSIRKKALVFLLQKKLYWMFPIIYKVKM